MSAARTANVADQPDRDLLNDEDFQRDWAAVLADHAHLSPRPVGEFADKLGRQFFVVTKVAPLARGQSTEIDRALADGNTSMFYFGAINEADRKCYAYWGLYYAEDLDVMESATIETDMNNRRLGIAKLAYEIARVHIKDGLKKIHDPGKRYTDAGASFANRNT